MKGFPGDLVTFDVGGTIFKTTFKTLEKCPDSFLVALVRNTWTFRAGDDSMNSAIFLDRSPALFEWILEVYRQEQVQITHKHANVSKELWDAELTYYGLFSIEEVEERKLPPNEETLVNLKKLINARSAEFNHQRVSMKRQRQDALIEEELEYARVIEYLLERDGGTATFVSVPNNLSGGIHFSTVHEKTEKLKAYAKQFGLGLTTSGWEKGTTKVKYKYYPANQLITKPRKHDSVTLQLTIFE